MSQFVRFTALAARARELEAELDRSLLIQGVLAFLGLLNVLDGLGGERQLVQIAISIVSAVLFVRMSYALSNYLQVRNALAEEMKRIPGFTTRERDVATVLLRSISPFRILVEAMGRESTRETATIRLFSYSVAFVMLVFLFAINLGLSIHFVFDLPRLAIDWPVGTEFSVGPLILGLVVFGVMILGVVLFGLASNLTGKIGRRGLLEVEVKVFVRVAISVTFSFALGVTVGCGIGRAGDGMDPLDPSADPTATTMTTVMPPTAIGTLTPTPSPTATPTQGTPTRTPTATGTPDGTPRPTPTPGEPVDGTLTPPPSPTATDGPSMPNTGMH